MVPVLTALLREEIDFHWIVIVNVLSKLETDLTLGRYQNFKEGEKSDTSIKVSINIYNESIGRVVILPNNTGFGLIVDEMNQQTSHCDSLRAHLAW